MEHDDQIADNAPDFDEEDYYTVISTRHYVGYTPELEPWSVQLHKEESDDLVGEAIVYRVLHATSRPNLYDLLDEESHDLMVIADNLINAKGIVPERLFGDGDDLLIIDCVRVEPEYRGHNLSYQIVKAAQERLLTGCHGLTVLIASPTEGLPDEAEEAYSEARAAAKAKLNRHWRKMGFKKRGRALVMSQ